MSKGSYIVLEGLDGSGKTTQFDNLAAHLGDNCLGVREPGGTPMSEEIRTLLKNKTIERSANTNMFLFSAARADLIDAVIRPTLQSGKHVLSDRNWLSTLAYQTAEGADAEHILQLSKLATNELFHPDILLLIDIPVDIAQSRLQARGGSEADYFDSKGPQYFEKVRQAYLQYAQEAGAIIIDGNQAQTAVWHDIKTALKDKI